MANSIIRPVELALGHLGDDAHSGISTGDEAVYALVRQINDKIISTGSTLMFGGEVTAAVDTTHTTIGALIGLDDDFFSASQYYIIPIYTTDGLAPIGEAKAITAFDGTLGKPTHGALSVACGVGDYCVIIHESIYETWAAVVNATYGLSALQVILGAISATATADDLSDIATTSANAKLRRILLRFSADAFTSTINGVARTDIEAMVTGLASYLSASGAALSIQVNNNTARSDYEQVWEDYLAIWGANGANVFNPSIGGSARTTLETALENLDLEVYTSGHTLKTPNTKIGDIARTIDLLLGARWDSSGDLGTDIGTIITAVGTTLPNAIAAIPTTAMRGTDNAFLASVGGALDTSAVYASATDKMLMAYVKGLVDAGIAVAGAINDVAPTADDFDTNLTEATNLHFTFQLMLMTSGVLKGQTHVIESYTGASKNCGFTAYTGVGWTEAPANGDAFIVLPNSEKYVTALLAILSAHVTKTYPFMDFWKDPVEEVQLADAATDVALGNITVAELPGTPVRAILMFKYHARENTNASANMMQGATVAATSNVIQIKVHDAADGTYIDAMNFVDHQFGTAGSTREGGDVLISSIDVAATVTANDIYTLRFLQSLVEFDNLNFNDVQFGLRIWYSI